MAIVEQEASNPPDLAGQPEEIIQQGQTDPPAQKNPIIMTGKEKPLPPELKGSDKGNRAAPEENPVPESTSPDSRTWPDKGSPNADRRRVVAASNFSRTIIAAYQPEADQINPELLEYDMGSNTLRSDIVKARVDIEKMMDDFTREDLSFWKVANRGIEGINKLVGSDMELMASRNENGEVSGFSFSSRILKISGPVRQKKASDN
jgi:hypothetical protein